MKIFNILTSRVITALIAVGFIIYFIFAMVDTGNTIYSSNILLENYNNAIAEQKSIEESIDKEESIRGSDEQIEQIARERLGLCKSNEKLFVDDGN